MALILRLLIELTAVGVQGAEDADLDAQLTRVAEHGTGGAAKKVVEKRPVVIAERPQQVWHGESDMLPVAVGQDVLLFGNPLFGVFVAVAAAAAGPGLPTLAEKARVRAVRRTAAIAANAHGAGTAGKHTLDGEFGPFGEPMAIFLKEAIPAVIVLEQKLFGSRYVHET